MPNRSSVLKLSTLLCAVVTATAACTSPGEKTAIGAGAGAAAGALAGAVIGHQTGNRGQGALIGAAMGGLLGGTVGNRLDKQAKELEAVAETKRTDQGILTKLKSDILFDTGKSNLKPAAVDNINKMSAILKKYPENVLTIRGYTDSVGSDQKNKQLSAERASSVKQAMISGGVPETAMTVVGMGENDPVGDNKTKAGRSENRRVEIEITADASKVPADAKKEN